MRVPDSLQAVPLAAFVASPEGEALIDSRPVLQDIVSDYCSTMSRPEMRLQARGLDFVGEGGCSQVWALDGLAIKANSPTTGRFFYEYGKSVPEDLLGQHQFMSALGELLARRTGGEISVPDQYFAMRGPYGNDLLVQKFMDGWMSLDGWVFKNEWQTSQIRELYGTIKARIAKGIGHSSLAPGLVDIGLLRVQRLHSNNILIPKHTVDPQEAPLCIIDQPSRGIAGKAGVLAARLRTHAKDGRIGVPAQRPASDPTTIAHPA